MRKSAKLLLLLTVCSLWFACGGNQPTPPTASPAPSPSAAKPATAKPAADEEGKKLYLTFCAQCHGANGIPADDDKLRSTDLTDNSQQAKWTEASIKDVILKGQGRMDAIPGITPAEAEKIAKYTKTLKK